MMQDVHRPRVYATKANENVDRAGASRTRGMPTDLLRDIDGICAPLEVVLGEGVCDGCSWCWEDVWPRDGRVEFDRLLADDHYAIVAEVHCLAAIVL